MNSRRQWLLTGVALALTLGAGTALAQVKIGVTLSATGPAASLGIPEKNTIALLPKEIGGKSVEYIVLDDGTDIEPIALPHPRIGDAPTAAAVLLDARETLIGLQRIAAGRDEIDDIVEIAACQFRIGRCGQHLAI